MDSSGIEEIEYLHPNKSIEDNCEMSRRTIELKQKFIEFKLFYHNSKLVQYLHSP